MENNRCSQMPTPNALTLAFLIPFLCSGTSFSSGLHGGSAGLGQVVYRGDSLEIRVDPSLTMRISTAHRSIAVVLPPVISLSSGEVVKDFRVYGVSRADSGGVVRAFGTKGNARVEATVTVRPVRSVGKGWIFSLRLRNAATATMTARSLAFPRLVMDARDFGADSAFAFWSFQGGTYEDRPDWIFPLKQGFSRDNSMGMHAADYGGGMPVVDLWTREQGCGVACLSRQPEPIALPVSVLAEGGVSIAVVDSSVITLRGGERFEGKPVLVMLHHGDFFNALRMYSQVLKQRGFPFPRFPGSAYEPEWCAWGYGRGFTPSQVLETLPLAQDLGMGWVTIDDGWQGADGDWIPVADKFPQGGASFKALTDSIHVHGMKARLWWVPFEAHDSAYSAVHEPGRMNEFGMGLQSIVALNHPDWFLQNEDGSRVQVSWWNSYTLCPAVPEVQQYYAGLVRTMLHDWGFDGFKIDGQNQNAVPPCYNPAHHHVSPLDAPRAVPEFFRVISAAGAEVDSPLFQMCACGTNFSLSNMPYCTQFVASDPQNGWQIRHRAKTYKALLGDDVPYSGDHVELTNRIWDPGRQLFVPDGEEDFASTVGVGGVLSTKFTLPGIPQIDPTLALTPEKSVTWRRWMDIDRRERISAGRYLNLYDIAFDRPETHVIQKGDTLYYAFFADQGFSGTVELRGLDHDLRYAVMDYANRKPFGVVDGGSPSLVIVVDHALLLKAIPLAKEE
jgi:alpha-galactosidase